jgi:hypothetical protein
MAEAARRTVIIRGQVVDRYSPRRSAVDESAGEWGSRTDSGEAEYRSRRPSAESRAGGYATRRADADLRPSSYATRRADADRRPSAYEGGGAVVDLRPSGYEPRRPGAGQRPAGRRRQPYDPPRARPDRIALWAVLLGVVLILAAATSSHAAVLAHAVAH